MAGDELHTIELSHDKPRLTGPRPTDLGTVPTGEDRHQDQDRLGRWLPGNQGAKDRGARTAIKAPYRAAKKRIAEAIAQGHVPAVADVLLRDALLIFTRSPW
jgi:hypothetical protein